MRCHSAKAATTLSSTPRRYLLAEPTAPAAPASRWPAQIRWPTQIRGSGAMPALPAIPADLRAGVCLVVSLKP
jgi:hypothetical protein